jgi:hypothetical protein
MSALDVGALRSYVTTDFLVDKFNCFSNEEIINAYEATAFTCPLTITYQTLEKAAKLRALHNIPKVAQEPLECYGYAKEWETLEDLARYENNCPQLSLQALLARDRIYWNRFSKFVESQSIHGMLSNLHCQEKV